MISTLVSLALILQVPPQVPNPIPTPIILNCPEGTVQVGDQCVPETKG
jgi:hypothetical protein